MNDGNTLLDWTKDVIVAGKERVKENDWNTWYERANSIDSYISQERAKETILTC
jgi:hypothetical protein